MPPGFGNRQALDQPIVVFASANGPVYLVEGGCVSRFLEILGRNAHVEKRFDLIGSSMVKVSRFLVILGRDRGCSWIKAKVGIKHAST